MFKMASGMLKPWEVIVLCVFASILCWTANFINQRVPIPYMDEIFHVPQAQQYCNGDYSKWDQKITTPPGLYFSSLPFSLITECSLDVLRATNILFTLANVYTMYQIRQHFYPDTILSSLGIVLLPVNFFFTFLYYTDPGCVFCLLIMYFLFLKKQHYLSALAGLMGIFFRQTSIVWVFFIACLTLDEILRRNLKKEQTSFYNKFVAFVKEALFECFGYAFVGIAFLLFLKVNGGITLGDKQAHEAVLHIPQIGYFLLFCLLFSAPYIFTLTNFLRFIDFATRHPIRILVGTLAMYGLFENFIHVHPYILADNRHYTFYIWRRFLSKQSVRQGLAVVYVYVGYALYNCVRHMSRSWIFLFAVCTAITVVPQKLLEFRYFVWPFLLLRLHFRQMKHQIAAELLAAIALNSITIYMFIYGTFIWKHDPENIQRFMW